MIKDAAQAAALQPPSPAAIAAEAESHVERLRSAAEALAGEALAHAAATTAAAPAAQNTPKHATLDELDSALAADIDGKELPPDPAPQPPTAKEAAAVAPTAAPAPAPAAGSGAAASASVVQGGFESVEAILQGAAQLTGTGTSEPATPHPPASESAHQSKLHQSKLHQTKTPAPEPAAATASTTPPAASQHAGSTPPPAPAPANSPGTRKSPLRNLVDMGESAAALISKPLVFIPVSVRDYLGYFALITLFWAAMVWAALLMLGPGSISFSSEPDLPFNAEKADAGGHSADASHGSSSDGQASHAPKSGSSHGSASHTPAKKSGGHH